MSLEKKPLQFFSADVGTNTVPTNLHNWVAIVFWALHKLGIEYDPPGTGQEILFGL